MSENTPITGGQAVKRMIQAYEQKVRPLSDQDVEDIAQAWAATTPGKWFVAGRYGNIHSEIGAEGSGRAIAFVWTKSAGPRGEEPQDDPEGVANAAFMANAHQYVPALLDKIADLSAALRIAQGTRDEVRAAYQEDYAKYRQAEREGRLVILPEGPVPDFDAPGLRVKYRVLKADTHEPVEGCFVLRPDRDPAAVAALRAYAAATDNAELAADILEWVDVPGPLMLEELRCHTGPIWIRVLDRPDLSGWHFIVEDKKLGIVAKDGRGAWERDEVAGCCYNIQTGRGYGENWLAYKTPPESPCIECKQGPTRVCYDTRSGYKCPHIPTGGAAE